MRQKIIDKEKVKFYCWVVLAFLCVHSLSAFLQYGDDFFPRTLNASILISYLVFPVFVLLEIAIPLFRLHFRSLVNGLLLIILLTPFFTFGIYGWRYLWMQIGIYKDFTPGLPFLDAVLAHSPFTLAVILFFAIARSVYNNYQLKQLAQELLTQKKEAELNYLKSQTNPHFLFNTLNNIYSLARDKNDLAPESILRLSKILRFMLYQTSADAIAVEEEVLIINHYISLEQLRYDDSLKIQFTTEIEDGKQLIPPLLLIPLVENAFKHGISESRYDPFIHIHLIVSGEQLAFTVKNSAEIANVELPIKENIGLSNLRKQLQLLYRDYDLSVANTGREFIAILNINLSSRV